jgi:hypothetical protein
LDEYEKIVLARDTGGGDNDELNYAEAGAVRIGGAS